MWKQTVSLHIYDTTAAIIIIINVSISDLYFITVREPTIVIYVRNIEYRVIVHRFNTNSAYIISRRHYIYNFQTPPDSYCT